MSRAIAESDGQVPKKPVLHDEDFMGQPFHARSNRAPDFREITLGVPRSDFVSMALARSLEAG